MPAENMFEQMRQSYQERKDQEVHLQEVLALQEVERRSVKDTLEGEIRSDFLSIEEDSRRDSFSGEPDEEDAEDILARADAARDRMEKDVRLKNRIRYFFRRKKGMNLTEENEPESPPMEENNAALFEAVDTDSNFHLDFVMK